MKSDWEKSTEYQVALQLWYNKPSPKKRFEHSREFANARCLYRKRINGGGDGIMGE